MNISYIASVMNHGSFQFEAGFIASSYEGKTIYTSYFDSAPPQDVPEMFEDVKVLKGNFADDLFKDCFPADMQ